MSNLSKSLVLISAVGLAFLAALTVMAKPGPAPAAPTDGTIVVDTTNPADVNDGNCSLIEAIIAANTDANYHGCTISGVPGDDTIQLQASAVYTLTGVHNTTFGANGLPAITSTVTIAGQNATLLRDPAAANFRIFYVANTGHLTLKELTATNGRTQTTGSWWEQAGAGLMSNNGTVVLGDCTFENNVAYSGGGVYSWSGDLDVSETTFQNNQAIGGSGGAISGGGFLTVTNSTLANNNATSRGGGIYLFGGVTIADTTIVNNTCDGQGGGIFIQSRYSTTSLNDVTIRGNTSSGEGGGLYMATNATIDRVTIDNNGSDANGGGVYLTQYIDAGSLSVTNSTIYSNTAQTSGGGLYVNYPGSGNLTTAVISYTTFASNTATSGAGGSLYNNQATLKLASSVVAHGVSGSGGANCDGNPMAALTSFGYNVESGTDCGLAFTGDQQNSTIRLGPLQDNGGDTHTTALLPGSVIDQIPGGANGCGTTITTDQRGTSRPQGSECDAGAYEVSYRYVYLPLVLKQ